MNVLRCRSLCLLAVLIVSAAITSGCGDGRPKRLPVSGQVLLDDKPLPGGFVRVVPDKGRPATGQLDGDGRFTLTTYEKNDGCLPGTHSVAVSYADSSNPHVYRSLIPEKYNNADTSGLSVTVDDPTDAMTIRISSKGWRPSRGQSTVGDTDPSEL